MATYTYDKEKGGLSERRSERRGFNLDDVDRQSAPDGDGPDVVKELAERIGGFSDMNLIQARSTGGLPAVG